MTVGIEQITQLESCTYFRCTDDSRLMPTVAVGAKMY